MDFPLSCATLLNPRLSLLRSGLGTHGVLILKYQGFRKYEYVFSCTYYPRFSKHQYRQYLITTGFGTSILIRMASTWGTQTLPNFDDFSFFTLCSCPSCMNFARSQCCLEVKCRKKQEMKIGDFSSLTFYFLASLPGRPEYYPPPVP